MPEKNTVPKQVFMFTIEMPNKDRLMTSRTFVNFTITSFLDQRLKHVIDGLRSRIEYRTNMNVLRIDYRKSGYTVWGRISADPEFRLVKDGNLIQEYMIENKGENEIFLDITIRKEDEGMEAKIVVEIFESKHPRDK